jgi:membrane protein
MDEDHLTLVAGGVAFFGFLSVFPALAALIATYGLVFDPAEVTEQVDQLQGFVPVGALELLEEQLGRLSDAATGSLSWSAVLALLLALWSASKGSRGIVEAINVAYDQHDSRGIVRLYLISLGMTIGSIVFVVVAIALVAGVPAVLAFAGLDIDATAWIRVARWPALLVILLLAIAAVYYVAPDRKTPKWQWVTPGSLLATLALLAASGLFSLYVTRFGDYNEVYGSLGAVAVFLLWLYIGSFVVLLGAELNAALERQVAAKTKASASSEDEGAGAAAKRSHAQGARDGGEQQHDQQRPERDAKAGQHDLA